MAKKDNGIPIEDKIKERFEKDFEAAKKFCDPIHMRMDKDYELYRNRRKSDTEFRVSKFFAYVETVVPFMVNNRVRGSVKAEFPEYTKHAEGMGYILDHTFDVNEWDYKAQRIAKMAEIYRLSLAYTGYDPDAKNGTGQLCITEINPRWCYFDPSVTDIQDSSFFIYVEPMRLTKAIKLHPDKADEIKSTVGKRGNSTLGDGRTRNWFQTFFRSVRNFLNLNWDAGQQTGSDSFLSMTELDEAEKRKDAVAYIHYWYRDDEDKWRVSYFADDVHLEDLANPFWHGELPYDAYVPTEDILSAVGLPMGEQLENISDEVNVLINEIIRNVKLANDPPVLKNTAFGNIQDDRKLTKPSKGEVIQVNNPELAPLNSIVDQLNVQQVPSSAFSLKEIIDMLEDQISGTNDTMRGMGDATSGKEVQLKQEAAYTRIKTKLDNFERFVKRMSEKTIVNAMQFIDTTRPFRVKGDVNQLQAEGAPFEIKPIQSGVDQTTGEFIYDRREFFMYANPNEWTKLDDEDPNNDDTPAESDEKSPETVKKAYRVLQFVVEIEAGSSLPQSRMARREEAKELFQAGVIDQQALLEAYEYPEADEIMKRMAEAVQRQQEAQMQAEQAKMEQEMQMKQMEYEFKAQESKANREASKEPQKQLPDIASGLDVLRQKLPEFQQLSDAELMAYVSQLNVGA